MRIKHSKSNKWIDIKCDGEDDKWIDINILILTFEKNGICKKLMEIYAKELDWELVEDKKGYLNDNGVRVFEIKIFPKGGLISPSALLKLTPNVDECIISILKNIIFTDDENVEQTKNTFSKELRNTILSEKGISDKQLTELSKIIELNTSDWKKIEARKAGGILIMKFDLEKAIKLDEKIGGLYSKLLFGVDWKDWKNQLIKRSKSSKYWFKNKEDKKKLKNAINNFKERGI